MKHYILGNWKSNGAPDLIQAFRELFASLAPNDTVLRGIAAPFHLLREADFSGALLGAENVSRYGAGAYTGEITAGMLVDCGCDFAIVGHSERRQYFAESMVDTAEKLARLVDAQVLPILCIGETLEQRRAGELETVLKDQLEALTDYPKDRDVVIAYEPVWAIGTGEAASESDVLDAHTKIRMMLTELGFPQAPILYGGSVKPGNAASLSQIDEVNGFLIGGASLKVDSFQAIIEAYQA